MEKGSNGGARSSYMLYAGLFMFMWIGWILLLAGTAASQANCNSGGGGGGGGTTGGNVNVNGVNLGNLADLINGRRLMSTDPITEGIAGARKLLGFPGRSLLVSQSYACSTNFALPWWVTWFQFFLTLAVIYLSLNEGLRTDFLPGTIVLFAIESTLLMIIANNFNSTTVFNSGKAKDAAGAGLAGCILLLLANLIFILCASSKAEWLQPNLSGGPGSLPSISLPKRGAASPPMPPAPTAAPAAEAAPAPPAPAAQA